MAESFTYDLVSFLRVLYRQRKMIVVGTIATAVLAVIVSLVWPETWRANARVFVSSPQFKENLRLVPPPYDVIAYQSMLIDDSLFLELQTTLVSLGHSMETLLREPGQHVLSNHHAEHAESMSPLELIGQTNASVIASILLEDPNGIEIDTPASELPTVIALITTMDYDDLGVLAETDLDVWEDITIFDLNRRMSADTSITKETNLETIYSPVIRVAGEAWSAESSRMITNVWLHLFERKAEAMAQSGIALEISRVTKNATEVTQHLASITQDIAALGGQTKLDSLRAEAASLNILLYGMAPVYEENRSKSEAFGLDDPSEAFLTETHRENQRTTFVQADTYDEALVPRYQSLLNEVPEENRVNNPELALLSNRIETVRKQLTDLNDAIQSHQVALSELEFQRQQTLNDYNLITDQVSEVTLLRSYQDGYRFADVSIVPATKPDKRVFPRRSYMVLGGMLGGFALFCGLAFFRDIWADVIREDGSGSAV